MPLSEVGFFYIVQLSPKSQPDQIKLGFSVRPEQRFIQHQKTFPEARLIKYWRTLREWEHTIIEYVTQGYTPIGREIFTGCNLGQLVERAEYLFSQAPAIPDTAIDRANWEVLSVYIPPDLRHWVKIHAIYSERDISEIAAEALQEYRARSGIEYRARFEQQQRG